MWKRHFPEQLLGGRKRMGLMESECQAKVRPMPCPSAFSDSQADKAVEAGAQLLEGCKPSVCSPEGAEHSSLQGRSFRHWELLQDPRN